MTSLTSRIASLRAPSHSAFTRMAAVAALGSSLLMGGCAVVSEGPVTGYPAGYPAGHPAGPGVAYPSSPGYGAGVYGGGVYSGSSGYYGGAVYGAPGYYPPAAVIVTPRIVSPVVPRAAYAAPVIVPPRAVAPVVVTRPAPPAGVSHLQPGYNPRNPGMSAPSFHGGAVTGTVPAYRPSPGAGLPSSRFGQQTRRSH